MTSARDQIAIQYPAAAWCQPRTRIRVDKGIGKVHADPVPPVARGDGADHLVALPSATHRPALGHGLRRSSGVTSFALRRPLTCSLASAALPMKSSLSSFTKRSSPVSNGSNSVRRSAFQCRKPFSIRIEFNRPRAEQLQPMRLARLAQRQIGGIERGVGHVDFIGQFAREADPQHRRRGKADETFAHAQPRETPSFDQSPREQADSTSRAFGPARTRMV